MRLWKRAFSASLLVGSILTARPRVVWGQSVREAVQGYVEEGLKRDAPAPRQKKPKRTKAPARPNPEPAEQPPAVPGPCARPPCRESVRARSSADSAKPEKGEVHSSGPDRRQLETGKRVEAGALRHASPPVPPAAAVPQRVLGRHFQLDLKVGAGVRGWYPAQFPTVRIDHAGYFTWSADVKARIFRYLRLRRGYYESTGLAGPRTSEAVVAQQLGRVLPKAAWLLGALGVPVSTRWETLVQYETRSFVTRARPSAPVAIAGRDTPAQADLSQLTRSAESLRFESGFETLVLAARYDPDQPRGGAGLTGESVGRLPAQYFGIGFMEYSKPYQVSINGDALDDVLFDGKFRGFGLAYGLALATGIDQLYGDLDVQAGVGQVSLLNGLTLNELLPDDYRIGYLQGNAKMGYTWPLFTGRPTVLFTTEGTLGGAGFFYVRVAVPENGSTTDIPSLNWDLFWSARASVSLPL